MKTNSRSEVILMGESSNWIRASAILLALTVTAVPVFAIFSIYRFDWYYAGGTGGESFAGNLTAGMDGDETELWVAMYDSASPDAQQIHVFDAQSEDWARSFSGGPGGIPISIFSFITVGDDVCLAGGSNGGAIYDRSSDQWDEVTVEEGLPSKSLYSGAIKDGEYWFGTNKGIGVLEPSGNWRYYTTGDGLPNSKVLDIVFDGDVAWICTENGVARFDTASGEWQAYSQADGLPGSLAETALKIGDDVWFAMKGGIGKIDTATGDISSFTPEDGLLGTEWKDIALFEDKIYFGCSKGINYIKRGNEDNWKEITTKDGLPDTAARKGLGSDVTHMFVQGDHLWIALWYEGLVRMSIPKGLAIIPTWFWIVLLAVLGIAALVVIRPGAEKGKTAEKKEMRQKRRKEAEKQRPPHQICGGVPKKELCNRCNFNTLKAGKLYCSKYKMPIEYGQRREEEE